MKLLMPMRRSGIFAVTYLMVTLSAGSMAAEKAAGPIRVRIPSTEAAPAAAAHADVDANLNVSVASTTDGLQLDVQAIGTPPLHAVLDDAISDIRAVYQAAGRIVVFGSIGPIDATQISIFDMVDSKQVDTFWALSPVISPDRQTIAFVKFFPLSSVSGQESQYRYYRLQDGAVGNRPPSQSDAPSKQPSVLIDVGKPLFSLNAPERDRRNTGVAEILAHQMQSAFAWSGDSSRVAFVDAQGGKLRGVVVSMDRDPPQAAIITLPKIDAMCMRGVVQSWCRMVARESIAVDLTSQGMTIKIPDHKSYAHGWQSQAKWAEFSPVAPH